MLPAVSKLPGVVICYVLLFCARHSVMVLSHSHGFLYQRKQPSLNLLSDIQLVLVTQIQLLKGIHILYRFTNSQLWGGWSPSQLSYILDRSITGVALEDSQPFMVMLLHVNLIRKYLDCGRKPEYLQYAYAEPTKETQKRLNQILLMVWLSPSPKGPFLEAGPPNTSSWLQVY